MKSCLIDTSLSYPPIRLRGLFEMPRDWPTVEQEELTSFVSACFNPDPIRYIFTWSLRSYPRRCPQSTTEAVTGTAPQVFLDDREVLKHFTGGRTFQRVSDLRGCDRRGSIEKEMHMILQNIERAYRPGIDFTDTADFL